MQAFALVIASNSSEAFSYARSATLAAATFERIGISTTLWVQPTSSALRPAVIDFIKRARAQTEVNGVVQLLVYFAGRAELAGDSQSATLHLADGPYVLDLRIFLPGSYTYHTTVLIDAITHNDSWFVPL